MKIFHVIARIGLAASIGLAGCVPPDDDLADVSQASRPTRDQFIVTLRDRGSLDEVAAAARRGGARIRHTYHHALRGFSFEGPPALAEALARRPDVASVMANRAVETAALTSPQILRTGTNRVDAELNPFAHIDNVDTVIDVNVAVVDRGIDATNDDLRVVGGVDCVASGDYDPLTEQFVQGQVRGHGTPIAGLIAARDNTVGVVGVAPGARLWSVRVFGEPGVNGAIDDVICGLNWIAATRTDADPTNDIAVANLSLGVENMGDTMPCGPSSHPLHQAVCGMVEVGVVPVVAAGNVAVNADTQAPASYPEVITVGAINDFDGIPGGLSPVNSGGTNPTCRIGVGSASVSTGLDDELAAYSNWGPSVDVVAPARASTRPSSATSPATGVPAPASPPGSSPAPWCCGSSRRAAPSPRRAPTWPPSAPPSPAPPAATPSATATPRATAAAIRATPVTSRCSTSAPRRPRSASRPSRWRSTRRPGSSGPRSP
jgi:hypothetical protein